MRHLVPALGQQSTCRVRIHRPWHRHNSPTVGLNSSFAQVVYRQGRQGRGQDREYPLKGRSPRNCGCCLEKQDRKGGETSGRRAAPKPPNKATPNPQRRDKLEPCALTADQRACVGEGGCGNAQESPVKAIPKGAEWVCIYTWNQTQPR